MGNKKKQFRARPPYHVHPAQRPAGPPPGPPPYGPPAGPSASWRMSSNHLSIGEVLRASSLRNEEIQRVEDALCARDQKIQRLGDALHARYQRIERIEDALRARDHKIEDAELRVGKKIYESRVLEESLAKTQEALAESLRERTAELEAAKARSAGLQERKELEAKLTTLQERKEPQDGLLRIAGKKIEKKLAEIEDLKAESEELTIKLQNAEISKAELRDNVVRIGMANQTEAMYIANEVSSNRTLQLIQGFRQDIGVKDAKIEEMETIIDEGDRMVERLQRALGSKCEEVQHLMQRVEQLVEREKKFGHEVEVLKAEVERLRRRVKEGEEIAGEQQGLIERLLKQR